MVSYKVENVISKEEVMVIIGNGESKSKRMYKLFVGGIDIKSISELMGVRYNFVYNVCSNELLKGNLDKELWCSDKKVSNKSEIIRLNKEGKNKKEICEELKIGYNNVWRILSDDEKREEMKEMEIKRELMKLEMVKFEEEKRKFEEDKEELANSKKKKK